jgi:hypothetical protein
MPLEEFFVLPEHELGRENALALRLAKGWVEEAPRRAVRCRPVLWPSPISQLERRSPRAHLLLDRLSPFSC